MILVYLYVRAGRYQDAKKPVGSRLIASQKKSYFYVFFVSYRKPFVKNWLNWLNWLTPTDEPTDKCSNWLNWGKNWLK